MHGLQGIRNINAAHRERTQYHDPFAGRDQSEDREPAPRYQRQSRNVNGNTCWAVYDSHTGGFGYTAVDVIDVDKEVDRLNAARTPLDAAAQQDGVNAALAKAAV